MYFKLSAAQENDLLRQLETGMGYQIVEATQAGSYSREKFLILNSEIVIEMNEYESDNIAKSLTKESYQSKQVRTTLR